MTLKPVARWEDADEMRKQRDEAVAELYRARETITRQDKAVGELTAELAEAREALSDYGAHQRGCILGQWEAGRPTELDGYQTKFRGKWYSPDKWPKCECGFDAAREASDA